MARTAVFSVDTVMFNIGTGERRVFPQGETDPGDAWSESPGGDPVGGKTVVQAATDVAKAQEVIDTLSRQIEANGADMARAAADRNTAVGMVEELEQARIAAETERDSALSAAKSLSAQLAQSLDYGKTMEARLAASEAQAATDVAATDVAKVVKAKAAV